MLKNILKITLLINGLAQTLLARPTSDNFIVFTIGDFKVIDDNLVIPLKGSHSPGNPSVVTNNQLNNAPVTAGFLSRPGFPSTVDGPGDNSYQFTMDSDRSGVIGLNSRGYSSGSVGLVLDF